jgi:hypothetical protein
MSRALTTINGRPSRLSDGTGRAQECAAGRVALGLAGARAFPQFLDRQLRRLGAQYLLDAVPDHLIAPQTIGVEGCLIDVLVDETAVLGGTEQYQPIGRSVEHRLQPGAAGVALARPFFGEPFQAFVQLAQPPLAVAQRRFGPLALADVLRHADDADGPAFRIADDAALHRDPLHAAVAQNSILGAVIAGPQQCGGKALLAHLPIFRIDQAQPFLEADPRRVRRVAVHLGRPRRPPSQPPREIDLPGRELACDHRQPQIGFVRPEFFARRLREERIGRLVHPHLPGRAASARDCAAAPAFRTRKGRPGACRRRA